MKTYSIIRKYCLICMEEHEVQTITTSEIEEFKGENVMFEATYEYCSNADQYMESEEIARKNNLAMKDAYRIKKGLLTSDEIIGIRTNLGVSQKDFSEILDWGRATITRYENHQVQDRAHDDILRKICSDPIWFLSMLERVRRKLSVKTYSKYRKSACAQIEKQKNQYLRDSIQAIYSGIRENIKTYGTELIPDKIIEIINYLARKIDGLDEAGLAILLKSCDALSIKVSGHPITGLSYDLSPNAILPLGLSQIIQMEGVRFEATIEESNCLVRQFTPASDFRIKILTDAEIGIIDSVIRQYQLLGMIEVLKLLRAEHDG